MAENKNMIQVDGAWIKTPSVFELSVNDVSASDAGRTQDGLMHKNRITRKRKIVLKWNGVGPKDAKDILQAFKNEYFTINYYDPVIGTRVTKTFYSGDQSMPIKTWTVGNRVFEQVSFDVIER